MNMCTFNLDVVLVGPSRVDVVSRGAGDGGGEDKLLHCDFECWYRAGGGGMSVLRRRYL